MKNILAVIGIILIAFWILGLTLKIAGTFIHLALLIGLVFLILNFVKRGK